VLLFALQRLQLEQWGLSPCLDGRVRMSPQEMPIRESDIKDLLCWPVTIGSKELTLYNERKLHAASPFTGKGTMTVLAAPTTAGPEYTTAGNKPERFSIKIYWPEEALQSERELLDNAWKAAGNDTDITNHLPIVVSQQDYAYTTGAVRRALGLGDSEAGHPPSRVLRAVVFADLEPITQLTGKDFVRAWLQCVRCERHDFFFHYVPLFLNQ